MFIPAISILLHVFTGYFNQQPQNVLVHRVLSPVGERVVVAPPPHQGRRSELHVRVHCRVQPVAVGEGERGLVGKVGGQTELVAAEIWSHVEPTWLIHHWVEAALVRKGEIVRGVLGGMRKVSLPLVHVRKLTMVVLIEILMV